MKNQGFQAQTLEECRRKLDTTLRQLTDDRLTEEQRRMVGKVIGWQRQYSFQVLDDPGAFCLKVNPKNSLDGLTVYNTIFGDLEDLEQGAAVLVRRLGSPGLACTVYIYLPREKGGERDDSRKEETTGP